MGQNTSVKRKGPEPVVKEEQIDVKVVLLGEQLVGKTPLICRLTKDNYVFNPVSNCTIGASYAEKIYRVSEHKTVKVEFWEIAGLNLKHPDLLPPYLRRTEGCLLVCDVTDQSTLDIVPAWKEKLDSLCKLPDGSPVPCLLLANKIDLAERRVVQADSLHEVSTRLGCVGWREVSVKDGTGVKEAFQFLLRQVLKDRGIFLNELTGMSQNTSVKRTDPEPTTKEEKIVIDMLLLGEQLVGKSPLRDRLGKDDYVFNPVSDLTIGSACNVRVIKLSEHQAVRVHIWESPGLNLQLYEKYPDLLNVLLRRADCCMLVCDVTDQRTLEMVPAWKDKLDAIRKLPDGSPVPCLLLANKIDLAERRVVQADSLQEVSARLGCVGWREVSVKDGTGVKEAFQFLLRRALKDRGILVDEDKDIV